MTDARRLVGLYPYGNRVCDAFNAQGQLIVVAENKESLGAPLENRFCTGDYPNVPNQPGDGKVIDVVIGDPYLLRKVKVVARWSDDSSEVPEDVRLALYSYSRNLGITSGGLAEIIVFETEDGSLVYAITRYTTLLENVEDMIDPELLEEHLRKA